MGKNSAGGYPLPTSFKELYITIFDGFSNRTYSVNASYHHITTMIDEYNAEYNLTFGFASSLENDIGWYAGGSIKLTKTTVNLMDYSFRGVDHSGDVLWLIYYK